MQLMGSHYRIYARESGGHFRRIVKGRLEKGQIGGKESFYEKKKKKAVNGPMFWFR